MSVGGTSAARVRAACTLAAVLGLALACARPPAVCQPSEAPAVRAAPPDPLEGLHRLGHAHNDYEHTHPLYDALDNRFYSVEADIWFTGARFEVSHWGIFPRGTLKALYLDPLQALVDQRGSVYGDAEPFTLWIDIKDHAPTMAQTLHDLLDSYPMLTRFTDTTRTPGPVTVVLTGDPQVKADVVDRFPSRAAIRDSNDFSLSDPPADLRWGYYALAWGDYLSDSQGRLEAEQERRLGCILENAHRLGRQVRFYGGPDNPTAWTNLLAHGADFINTDDLPGLSQFFTRAAAQN